MQIESYEGGTRAGQSFNTDIAIDDWHACTFNEDFVERILEVPGYQDADHTYVLMSLQAAKASSLRRLGQL